MNISDNYVDLLERVITENRELRETVKTQGECQKRMLNDLMERLNKRGQCTADEGRKASKKQQKIKVPPLCRGEFRKMYRILIKGDDFGGFVFTESYSAKQNQDITKLVIRAVEEDNGGPAKCPWSHAQLKGAGATYFKSKRDNHSRKVKNQVEEHRTLCRRQGRMRDKLQRRITTLDKTIECEEQNKVKIRKALTLEYTSSDESDISDGEEGTGSTLKGYLVKRLPWEKGTLRKLKKQLDNAYLKNLPARSKRNLMPRSRHTKMSTRPMPLDIIRWAVRDVDDSANSFSSSTPTHTSTPK